MITGKSNFTEDFKLDAIEQIMERGHSVAAVSSRLGVSTHSLYAWMKRYAVPPVAAAREEQPFSKRALEDERQTQLLMEAWEGRGKVYGYRKLHDDLQDQGETCCPDRVARVPLIREIVAETGSSLTAPPTILAQKVPLFFMGITFYFR